MIFTTQDVLDRWLAAPDGSGLEFKKARRGYEIDKLAAQCVALANGGGGRLILGVTDKRPREIVGTVALEDPVAAQEELLARLGQRVLVEEVRTALGRVVVVHVPARLPGTAWHDGGRYLERTDAGLAPLAPDALRALLSDEGPDLSATVCRGATPDALAPEAVADLRARMARAAADDRILDWSDADVLARSELVIDGEVTFAALVLLGARAALLRWLPQAETVLERRFSEVTGPAAERVERREGLLPWLDALVEQAAEGEPRLDRASVREAVLNAVAHRDYRAGGSIRVTRYPDRLEVASPGGLPRGVTAENLADQHVPRNRRILEVLRRAGLADRSGQGANLLVERAIRHGRPLPRFAAAEHEVRVTLPAAVEQPALARLFGTPDDPRWAALTTWDHLALHLVARGEALPDAARARLPALVEAGALEPAEDARGLGFLLSALRGGPARRPALRHEAYRDLLLRHVVDHGPAGAPMSVLRRVIPGISSKSVLRLLGELRAQGLIELRGQRRAARWYPVAAD